MVCRPHCLCELGPQFPYQGIKRASEIMKRYCGVVKRRCPGHIVVSKHWLEAEAAQRASVCSCSLQSSWKVWENTSTMWELRVHACRTEVDFYSLG